MSFPSPPPSISGDTSIDRTWIALVRWGCDCCQLVSCQEEALVLTVEGRGKHAGRGRQQQLEQGSIDGSVQGPASHWAPPCRAGGAGRPVARQLTALDVVHCTRDREWGSLSNPTWSPPPLPLQQLPLTTSCTSLYLCNSWVRRGPSRVGQTSFQTLCLLCRRLK